MVLIPLRGSGTRGDQVENARFFEKAGAAVMLLPEAAPPPASRLGGASGEDHIAPEELVRVIRELAEDPEKLAAMAAAAAKIGEIDGAALIARAITDAVAAVLPALRRG
jgi:UDP-N-acetylglucosamine--N-acetylmuramyl-(pentapeptide) pyrophosphoryl-undecaprenol N-acetylglucosamine transferase